MVRTRVLTLAIGLSLLLPALASAQTYRTPRTPAGHPDLQGVWANGFLTTLERPAAFQTLVIPEDQARAFEAGHNRRPVIPGDNVGQDTTEWWELDQGLARINGQARSSWIVEPADGKLPYSPAGQRILDQRMAANQVVFDGPEARPPFERCLIGGARMGPPMVQSGYSNNYQIVQTRDHVVIYAEMVNDVRIIRLDDRTHLPSHMQPWMGDSVGWWEGETLVVETTNLHPGDTVRTPGRLQLSPTAKVTERFRRISPTAIRYDYAVADPAYFSQTWRGEALFEASNKRPMEYACHEGNYALAGILAGARQAEALAAR